MAEYTQTDTPIRFPRPTEVWYEDLNEAPSDPTPIVLEDGDTFVYKESNLVYTFDTNYKIWTGSAVQTVESPPPPPPDVAPVIGSVTVTEDSPGGDRFMDQSFTVTLDMDEVGDPTADISVRAKFKGNLVQTVFADTVVDTVDETITNISITYNNNMDFRYALNWPNPPAVKVTVVNPTNKEHIVDKSENSWTYQEFPRGNNPNGPSFDWDCWGIRFDPPIPCHKLEILTRNNKNGPWGDPYDRVQVWYGPGNTDVIYNRKIVNYWNNTRWANIYPSVWNDGDGVQMPNVGIVHGISICTFNDSSDTDIFQEHAAIRFDGSVLIGDELISEHLKFTGPIDTTVFKEGTIVHGVTSGANAEILEVVNPQEFEILMVSGQFDPGERVYAVVRVPDSESYCDLALDGKATGIHAAAPDYTHLLFTGDNPSTTNIYFDADPLRTTWDDVLPEDTEFIVEVKAENTTGPVLEQGSVTP